MTSHHQQDQNLRDALARRDGLLLRPLVWALRVVLRAVVWAHGWFVAIRTARRIRRAQRRAVAESRSREPQPELADPAQARATTQGVVDNGKSQLPVPDPMLS